MSELIESVVPVLLEALFVAAGLVFVWSKSGIKKLIDSRTQSYAVAGVLNWLNELVYSLVMEAQQTAVNELKKARADGRVTPEEYKKKLTIIRENVLAKLRQLTVGKLMSTLHLEPSQVDTLLSAKVESVVLATKLPPVVSDPLAPPPG